jgi:alkanesulfonate monooxygenase SsuD/methylene tetrahydromethanopterin reductase-like flavin-dependent oxidoreductase (luciferase family)
VVAAGPRPVRLHRARQAGGFGRSYAAEPEELAEQLKEDTAIDAADTLLLTVPNQLGVDYNAHAIESILRDVAPELGWR